MTKNTETETADPVHPVVAEGSAKVQEAFDMLAEKCPGGMEIRTKLVQLDGSTFAVKLFLAEMTQAEESSE